MYKIIGTDNKAYGPVSSDQLGEWLKEGRLHRLTQVQSEASPDWKPLESHPEFADRFPSQAAPPRVAGETTSVDSGFNAVIPYRNVRALVAYYCAIFSLIPLVGLVLGFAGLVLGILGVRFRRQNPAAGGGVHAWIGIILGGLCGFGNLAFIIFVIIAAATSGRH